MGEVLLTSRDLVTEKTTYSKFTFEYQCEKIVRLSASSLMIKHSGPHVKEASSSIVKEN